MNYQKLLQSSRLRKFLIISLIVHITLACTTVVPYYIKQYLHKRQLRMERIAHEKAKKEAEERARKAADAAARKKILEVLKEDAEKLLEDIAAENFEQMWDEMLKGLDPQIAEMLDQLSDMDFQVTQEQLEAMLEQLRLAEIQNLRAQMLEQSKRMIAMRILEAVRNSIPGFNKEVEKQLKEHGRGTKKALDRLLKKESIRRKRLRTKAVAELDRADNSLESIKKTPGNSGKNLKEADSSLLESARLADEASENRTADAVQNTAAAVRTVDSAQPDSHDITRIRKEIDAHKTSLAQAGKDFSEQARTALKNVLSENSAASRKSSEFVETTIREKVAEKYRARTENLVSTVLKENGMNSDRGFAEAVGRKTVEILLKGSMDRLKAGAFRHVDHASARAQGLSPHTEGRQTEHTVSRSRGKGAFSLEDTLGRFFGKEIRKGMGKALKKAEGQLGLPSAASLGGQSGKISRLSAAAGNIGRHIRAGGMPGLPSLKRSLSEVGRARQLGISPFIRKALSNNSRTYRENMDTVLRDRIREQQVLTLPSDQARISKAETGMAQKRIAEILLLDKKTEEPEPEEEKMPRESQERKERTLREPGFKTFVYGGAPFAEKPPVIDGDLSEWKDIEEFKLRGTVQRAYWKKPLPEEWENNRYLMVQWNHTGLYFAWRMADARDDTRGNNSNFWSNDGIELLFDFSNRRKERLSRDTQHFWFWPLGSSMDADIIGGEADKGTYNVRFRRGGTHKDPRMGVTRTVSPRGYQVELFMPGEAFSEPDLKPGRIIAFNFSINNGTSCSLIWAVNLGRSFAHAPNLWGDLALLGTDAEITFVRPGTEKTVEVIIPGEPAGVRIADADMNLDRKTKDKIEVTLRSACGDRVTGYLEETGPDSGIFQGNIDTLQFLGETASEDMNLSVTPGGHVTLSYMDQACRYGERNNDATQTLRVGYPVLKFSNL